MKIQIRNVRFLALGFVIGSIVTVTFTSILKRVPTAPASKVVATKPVVAVASLPPQFIITTNIQLQLPRLPGVKLDASFDSQSPLDPPMRRSLDLIDTRYQPDIKREDLR